MNKEITLKQDDWDTGNRSLFEARELIFELHQWVSEERQDILDGKSHLLTTSHVTRAYSKIKNTLKEIHEELENVESCHHRRMTEYIETRDQ